MKDNIFYVGMDVHKATTVMVILDSSGKQTMQQIVATKASTIVSAIKAVPGTVHLTFEEGIHAAWLYDLLLPHVEKLLVCDTKKIKLHATGNKNDQLDAFRLAECLRLGSITGVYHGQHGLRTLQELAHSYQYLVADCTRIKNRIKAIFRGRGIACQGDAVYHTDKRQQWLAHLTELGLRTRALRLYAELDCLTSLRAQAEQEMIAEARKQAAFKLLDAIPTLGPVRVALILATMVTPHRFRTKRQLWTYSGFAVISRTSSDFQINNGQIKRVVQKTATRGLNENYNRTLKQVFKAAANSVRSGPLKLYYDGLRAQGMRDEMARLNVARKIATLTLTIWKKGVKFDPAYLQAHTV
jgi:transposase